MFSTTTCAIQVPNTTPYKILQVQVYSSITHQVQSISLYHTIIVTYTTSCPILFPYTTTCAIIVPNITCCAIIFPYTTPCAITLPYPPGANDPIRAARHHLWFTYRTAIVSILRHINGKNFG